YGVGHGCTGGHEGAEGRAGPGPSARHEPGRARPRGWCHPASRGGGRVVSGAEPGAEALVAFLDGALGEHQPTEVAPMQGGGSCEIFSIDRGGARWVLRRAPAHASSRTAHDVTREFRVLDAIKDAG